MVHSKTASAYGTSLSSFSKPCATVFRDGRQVSVDGHASSVALSVISCDARSLDLRVTVVVQLVAEAKLRVLVVGALEDELEFAGHCRGCVFVENASLRKAVSWARAEIKRTSRYLQVSRVNIGVITKSDTYLFERHAVINYSTEPDLNEAEI